MSEWDRADADGMEMVNSAQYHAGLDQLWNALKDEDGNIDTQGKDAFTLAAEEIGDLRCLLKAQQRHSAVLEDEVKATHTVTDHFMNRYYDCRRILEIITRLSRGFSFPPFGPNHHVPLDNRLDAVLKLATETLEGKYTD